MPDRPEDWIQGPRGFEEDIRRQDTMARDDALRTAAQGKASSSLNDYMQISAQTDQRLLTIQEIQKGNMDYLKDAMQEVLEMDSEHLREQAKRLGMVKGLESAIAEVKEKGYRNTSDEGKARLQGLQKVVAQEKALKQLGPEGGQSARELIRQAGGKPDRFDLKGQIEEFKTSASGVDLTKPQSWIALMKANPILSSVLIGARMLPNMESRGIGVSLPMLGNIKVPGSDFGNVIREGQVTGGGYGEGIAARAESFSMALNPFDSISKQVADSIVKAVRGRGFTGALGRAFQDSVAGVYKDLGIDPNLAAQLGEPFARRGQLDEFRMMVKDLDEVAKNSNRSIDDITQLYQGLQDQFLKTGGMRTMPIVSGLTNALAGMDAFRGLSKEQFAQMGPSITGMVSQLSGMPPGLVGTKEGLLRALPQMETTLEGFSRTWQSLPQGFRRDAYLAGIMQTGAFGDLGFEQVRAILTSASKGRFVDRIREEIKKSEIKLTGAQARDIYEKARQESGYNLTTGERLKEGLDRLGIFGKSAKERWQERHTAMRESLTKQFQARGVDPAPYLKLFEQGQGWKIPDVAQRVFEQRASRQAQHDVIEVNIYPKNLDQYFTVRARRRGSTAGLNNPEGTIGAGN